MKNNSQSPLPFGKDLRIMIKKYEWRDICERLDLGNSILSQMNTKLGKLDSMDNKLSDISNKLDTLPEKIAEAIKE